MPLAGIHWSIDALPVAFKFWLSFAAFDDRTGFDKQNNNRAEQVLGDLVPGSVDHLKKLYTGERDFFHLLRGRTRAWTSHGAEILSMLNRPELSATACLMANAYRENKSVSFDDIYEVRHKQIMLMYGKYPGIYVGSDPLRPHIIRVGHSGLMRKRRKDSRFFVVRVITTVDKGAAKILEAGLIGDLQRHPLLLEKSRTSISEFDFRSDVVAIDELSKVLSNHHYNSYHKHHNNVIITEEINHVNFEKPKFRIGDYFLQKLEEPSRIYHYCPTCGRRSKKMPNGQYCVACASFHEVESNYSKQHDGVIKPSISQIIEYGGEK